MGGRRRRCKASGAEMKKIARLLLEALLLGVGLWALWDGLHSCRWQRLLALLRVGFGGGVAVERRRRG